MGVSADRGISEVQEDWQIALMVNTLIKRNHILICINFQMHTCKAYTWDRPNSPVDIYDPLPPNICTTSHILGKFSL